MATKLVNKRLGGMRTGPGATTAAAPRTIPRGDARPRNTGAFGAVPPPQPFSRGRLGVGGRSRKVR